MMLLVRPSMREGESIESLMLRVAQRNGYDGIASLFGAQGHANLNLRSQTMLAHYSDSLAHVGIAIPTSLSGVDLMKRALVRWQRRAPCSALCPQCLRENAYLRGVWDIAAYTRCHVHGCLLIDKCPSCLSALTWKRQEVERCRCGYDFRDTPSSDNFPASAVSIFSLISAGKTDDIREIGDLIHACEVAGIATNSIDSHDRVVHAFFSEDETLAGQMRHFALENADRLHPRLTLLPILMVNGAARRCAIKALSMMENCDFPKRTKPSTGLLSRSEAMMALGINSHHVLSRLIKTKLVPKIGSIGKAHGRFIRISGIDKLLRRLWVPTVDLKGTLCANNDFLDEVIKAALRSPALSNSYRLATGLTSLRVSMQREDAQVFPGGALPIPKAARNIGVHSEIVRSLIQRGYLKATKGSPKFPTAISVESVRIFKTDYTFASELAASVLSKPRRFAEKLFAFGVRPVSGPSIDGLKVYLFKRSDLIGISMTTVAALRGTKIPYSMATLRLAQDVSGGLAIPLRYAAEHLGVSQSDVSTLIRRGYLTRAIVPGVLVMVDGQSLREYAEKFLNPQKMCIEDAAASCGITVHQFSARWVTSKRIETENLGVRTLVPRMNYRNAEFLYQPTQRVREASELGRSDFRSAIPDDHLELFERNAARKKLDVMCLSKGTQSKANAVQVAKYCLLVPPFNPRS